MKCPCDNGIPDPCPLCGATVSGQDAVNGICQVNGITSHVRNQILDQAARALDDCADYLRQDGMDVIAWRTAAQTVRGLKT
jgi:hypothetical protein